MAVLDGVAVALVAGAALAGAGWLADLVERTALVAAGPVAGQPAAARAAAAALALAPPTPWRPARTRTQPAAGAQAAVGRAGALRPAAGRGGSLRPAAGRAGALRPAAGRRGSLRPAAGPGAVGIAAAALGGLVAWAAGAAPELPAVVFLAGAGLVLAPVDVRAHRLPDAIVLPAYPLLAVLLCVGGLTGATGPAPLVRAAQSGAVAFGVVYLLAVAVPAGFGYGDVKLTGLLGAGLGWYGWSAVLDGLVYGFVYGGLCAAALLVSRRLARTDRLAFGPFLLAGALTALVTH